MHKSLYINLICLSERIFILLLYFLLCTTPILAQPGKRATKLDDLERKCEALVKERKWDKAVPLARRALLITPQDDHRHLSLFNYVIGRGTELPVYYDTAIYYLETSLKQGRETGDVVIYCRPLRGLILAYYAAGDKAKITTIAKELEAISDTSRNRDMVIYNHCMLAEYYSMNGLYEIFLQYQLESIDYTLEQINKSKGAEKDDYISSLAVDYLKVAELYTTNLNQPEKSFEYLALAKPNILPDDIGSRVFYNKFHIDALLALDRIEEASVYYDSLKNICDAGVDMACNVLFAIDLSYGDYFLKRNDLVQAGIYASKANRLIGEFANDPLSKAQWNVLQARIFMFKKQFQDALPLLLNAEKEVRGLGQDFENGLNKNLGDCYAQLQQWDKSSYYYQKHINLSDTIYNEKLKQRTANAEAKFQNKHKQQQIENQHTIIRYADKQRIWLVSGLVLLMCVILLLIRIYRNKKKVADLLDKKNREQAELNVELNDANKTKATLFSVISHDLRSPINQVHQFLKLQQLAPGKLKEEERSRLSSKIQTATGTLLETMEDLLLWSKTQMNHFTPQIQPVLLKPLIEQITSLQELNAEARHVVFNIHLPDGASVNSDPYFLQTILRNLIQNATKASDEHGIIDISYSASQHIGLLSISNSGNSFTQSDFDTLIKSETTITGVSGLGLKLAYEFSLKINSSIGFSSNNGVTTVTITLPLNS